MSLMVVCLSIVNHLDNFPNNNVLLNLSLWISPLFHCLSWPSLFMFVRTSFPLCFANITSFLFLAAQRNAILFSFFCHCIKAHAFNSTVSLKSLFSSLFLLCLIFWYSCRFLSHSRNYCTKNSYYIVLFSFYEIDYNFHVRKIYFKAHINDNNGGDLDSLN